MASMVMNEYDDGNGMQYFTMPLIKKPEDPAPRWKPPHKIDPVEYLTILFNDLLYDRLHRNDKLSETFGRKIKFLDELTKQEVSEMIEILREQKGQKKGV
jgi:hypothetical protein